MPCVARNDTLFKEQQLICYRILKETDSLSMDHQVDCAAKAVHCELDPVRSTKSSGQKTQQ